MAKRQFHDSRGAIWDVWDVLPGDMPRASRYDRRAEVRTDSECEDTLAASAPLLDPELEAGWLCFQSGMERRRFAPIPPQWVDLPDGVLRVMLDVSRPVGAAHHHRRAPAAD